MGLVDHGSLLCVVSRKIHMSRRSGKAAATSKISVDAWPDYLGNGHTTIPLSTRAWLPWMRGLLLEYAHVEGDTVGDFEEYSNDYDTSAFWLTATCVVHPFARATLSEEMVKAVLDDLAEGVTINDPFDLVRTTFDILGPIVHALQARLRFEVKSSSVWTCI